MLGRPTVNMAMITAAHLSRLIATASAMKSSRDRLEHKGVDAEKALRLNMPTYIYIVSFTLFTAKDQMTFVNNVSCF